MFALERLEATWSNISHTGGKRSYNRPGVAPARALLQKAGGDTAPARDARDASGAAEPEVDAQLVCALSL
jgi:hypothetical protein